MKRPSSSRGVLTVVVAVLCIAGIAMAAATLTTADPIGADDEQDLFVPPSPGGEVDIDNDSGGPDVSDEPGGGGATERMTMTTCVEVLDGTSGILGVVVGFMAIVGLIYYRFNFSMSMLAGWTLLPPVMLVYFLVTDCGPSGSGPLAGGSFAPDGSGGGALVPVGAVPPWALGLLVGGVFVVAAVALYRSTGEDEVVISQDEGVDEPELDQFAEAAGKAADRIEEHNADVDNTVYRAWLEMTGLLNVDRPETYSAGEFADAAIDLGMAESDVSELTELFNEVRYGGKDAAAREDRAIEILRTIESQYSAQETNETQDELETETETETETDTNSTDTDDVGENDDDNGNDNEDGEVTDR
ncbi:DUF4129 domain-containing protein [Halobacteria archaeon AArc-m2/3/4]|uniref:DUF4129 domain-containing protein n=1 Tax=Natronoglomus mannanivorans TaxID=2979990 RepID=A0AAP2YZN6_9EURY|nr:DUF4129 domain-containing protein [Halobacteria archaeon AArc-xg1-1]MCU4973521.1 DUF4129 domain-containing protein [Halobacteria archaeon AArc-m2/3/4]